MVMSVSHDIGREGTPAAPHILHRYYSTAISKTIINHASYLCIYLGP